MITLTRLEIDFILTVLRNRFAGEDIEEDVIEAISMLEALLDREEY